jgi:hypothetical protein
MNSKIEDKMSEKVLISISILIVILLIKIISLLYLFLSKVIQTFNFEYRVYLAFIAFL